MIARILQASLAALMFVLLPIMAVAAEPPAKVTADQAPAGQWPAMAQAGDPLAQALLARAYLYGTDGMGMNPDMGTAWADRSAAQNHPLGLFMRGYARYSDRARPKAQREEEAKAIFEQAIAAGFEKQAEQGCRQWLEVLGDAHHLGWGMPKNSEEAVKWWRKSAALGDANAMVSLGIAYARGDGVPKDREVAVRWFRKASELGDSGAMACLGASYRNGTGIAKDEAVAVEWYRKSAARGNGNGMTALGLCYLRGTGVPQDEHEGLKWLLKAADADSTNAMLGLGQCYEKGVGVTTDKKEAAKWYRKAAALGDDDAMDALERLEGGK